MNQQTPIDNNILFRTGPQRKPEATTSWWITTPPGEMTRTAEQPEVRNRLRRSIGAAMVQGGIIVGHVKSAGRL